MPFVVVLVAGEETLTGKEPEKNEVNYLGTGSKEQVKLEFTYRVGLEGAHSGPNKLRDTRLLAQ